MKLVIFGLSVSSSWGNGHATLWRGLIKAMARRGWRIVFYERDVPYYAAARDMPELPDAELVLYDDWSDVSGQARRDLADAEAGFVTSYCPHGVEATELLTDSPAPLKVFYDLDTPITLSRLDAGESLSWLGPRGLRDFDLVLSYTGGGALDALKDRLGARRVAPLYGWVDPEIHRPVETSERFRSDLSYLGSYAEDRQKALQDLFIDPARLRPDSRFTIGGAQYPQDFPWTDNIFFVRHLPPSEHAAFFSSSRLTLNVTRAAMAWMGWCPSGRLFEAAACGAPVLSDVWPGLEDFFEPGREILTAATTGDVLSALSLDDAALRRIADAARARTLAEHVADARAATLETLLSAARTAHPET